MAGDIFIKIGSIKGESEDKGHKDEIEVMSWSWGMAQHGSMSHGGGGGSGKVSFSDLSFVHAVDKASPNLMLACATGEHIADATLCVRKAGTGKNEPKDYLIIKMTDVIITSVAPSGANDGGNMHESVSMQFAKVDLEYKPQDSKGALGAGIHFKYDIKQNVAG